LLALLTCILALVLLGPSDRAAWQLLAVAGLIVCLLAVLIATWIAWMLVVRRGVLTWMRLAWAPAKALARGDRAEAERALSRALARAYRFPPQDRRRGLMLVQLAGFVKGQGRYAEAKALFEESIAILAHRWRSSPLDYFVALNNYAVYLIDLCDHAAAQRILEQILDLTLFWKKSRQASRASGDYQAHALEMVLHLNLVVLFLQMDELADVADHVQELDAIFPRLSRRQQARLGDHYWGTRALWMHARGRFANAAREIEQAKDANYPMCLQVRAKLALVRLDLVQAEQLLRMLFDLERKKGSLHRPELRMRTLELAESLFGQGKHDEAFAALQEARAIAADFALPPVTAWRQALASWLQRAKELHRPDLAALLETDLRAAAASEQAITISPRLRIRPPTR
jgi:tetratricopeptide (TPR) repeat protein